MSHQFAVVGGVVGGSAVPTVNIASGAFLDVYCLQMQL